MTTPAELPETSSTRVPVVADITYSTYFGGAGYEEEASVLVDREASSFSDQDGIATMPGAANSESGSYAINACTDVTEDPVTFDLNNLPGFQGCPGDLNKDGLRSVQDLFHIMPM